MGKGGEAGEVRGSEGEGIGKRRREGNGEGKRRVGEGREREGDGTGSIQMSNLHLLKFLNSNFSKTGRRNCPKFSGIIEGSSVCPLTNF